MRWPLGVVDIVVRAAGRRRRTRARRGAADGFAHIDPLLGTDPASLALPIGCPTAFPKPHRRVVHDARAERASSTGCGSARCAGGAPRRGALLEPWAGAVVNSPETVRAFRAEVRRRAAARRHRPRRRLGRRSVRAARARRPRAAAPGQARAHAAARRRSDRRRRLRRGARARSSSSTTAASSASSTSTCPRTAGRSPIPSSGPRDLAARAPRDLARAQAGPGQVGRGRPGVGIPSNATRSPGIASVTNSVRRSAPPKQQLVREALALDRPGSRRSMPSGSTTRMPCSIVDAT